MVKFVLFANGLINLKSINVSLLSCPLVFVHFNLDRIRKKFMISEEMNRSNHDRALAK